ncbi:MAG: hypothetical protein Q9207_003713 [Kuettlingeria erythrocarpa]
MARSPHPYYVTCFYERGTLANLFREKIGEEMYPRILLQLLLGLREFHRLGLAHRDLKEENIFVDDDLNLILGDPDFLKSKKNNVLKTFCGTHLYAAPEIYKRDKHYGKSVDVWSLAICILNSFDHLTRPSVPVPYLGGIDELKAWNRNWCQEIFRQLHELDENGDQIIDILKPMLEYDPAKRCTVDQCLKRGCENGLFKENRLGDIVLAEATEVNTEANTPACFISLSESSLSDGEKTPKPRSPLYGDPDNVALPFTIQLEEIPANSENVIAPQLSFLSFLELPKVASGHEVSASEMPLSFLGEIYGNPIPTAELPEEIPGDAQDGATPQPTFPSISDFLAFAPDDNTCASANPSYLWREICDTPIPTIEFS